MSIGGEDATELGTIRGRDWPSVRQLSIFSPNKLGQLRELIRSIETARMRVCALSISDSAECAIIRLVVSHTERVAEILTLKGYRFCEVDLLAVELPNVTQPLLQICSTLLQGEIDIRYCFPLIVHPHGRPAIALFVDDHELACQVLHSKGFTLISELDLQGEDLM